MLLTTRITMFSQDPAMAAGWVYTKSLGHQIAKSGCVQIAATSNHTVFWQATQLPGDIGQYIHWKEKHAQ